MKEFRKIEIKPLKSFSDLNLNVVKQVNVGTVNRNEEVDKHLTSLFNYVNRNPDISMVGVRKGKDVFLSSQVKSSANKKKIYTFPEPNPVCIYYNIANENLEKSAKLKNTILSKEQNFDAFDDFDKFSQYYSLTSQGIIFLITTVEGFINQFFEEKEYTIDGKAKTKKDLEWSNLDDKLNIILPELLGLKFSELHNEEYQSIINSNLLRNDLIHLKRTEKSNNTSYQELFKKLIDYKHHKSSEAVYKFLTTLKPNYFDTKK
ncbi:hypothetical protein [Winogradskyella sp. SYSU M77433]|uniref:hypothetical protein n=1 Tax=Winogradskyella sp. SYSU M77433 TaxID=3042722 RepID=UPI0024807497|nr:hypothetical protein [Winogradskyella sp. SYSU M77433]MDH7913214.1 hypothetical protein [Winogradskyella sp. SYSU M77433]